MTQLNDTEIDVKREVPPIEGEEDTPLPGVKIGGGKGGEHDNLGTTEDLDKAITKFRFRTGRKVLYIAMGAMGGAVVLDLIASMIPGMESTLISGAFEAFKLITMTVLGYIFGSNNSK